MVRGALLTARVENPGAREVLAGAKERRKLANQKAREEVQRRVSFSSLQAPKEEVRRYSAPWAGKFTTPRN